VIDESKRRMAALHEAAHAVVAISEGRRVGAITINVGLIGNPTTGYERNHDGNLETLRADLRIVVAGDIGADLGTALAATVSAPAAPLSDDDIYGSAAELRLLDSEIADRARGGSGQGMPVAGRTDDESAANLAARSAAARKASS
jgi:hypothetical protein